MESKLTRRQLGLAAAGLVGAPQLLLAHSGQSEERKSEKSEPTPVGGGERPIVKVYRFPDQQIPEKLISSLPPPWWVIDHKWALKQFQCRQPNYIISHPGLGPSSDCDKVHHIARLPFFLPKHFATYFPMTGWEYAGKRVWGNVRIIHSAVVNKVSGLTLANVFYFDTDRGRKIIG